MTYKIENIIGLDLFIIIILAVLTLVFVLVLPEGNILRILLGLPYILVLPGYSLVSALWTKKTEMGLLERGILSLGLSIALVAFVGLGLNYTPYGITMNTILFTLFGLIIVLVGLTFFRRAQLKPEERFRIDSGVIINHIDGKSSTDKILVLVIGIAMIIGVILIGYIALNQQNEEFTELYILDENQTIENFPSSLTINQNGSIYIVVENHERKANDYNILVWLRPQNGTDEILNDYDVSLDSENEWRQSFIFSINESGLFMLDIELYKANEAIPYTTNHLWIDVIE
jgi:uncharacterized membrane protein